MDRYAEAFYELSFKVSYMEKRGNAFQDFFSDLMEKCYPDDFQRVRPWGRLGDQKNDGYLRSERTLFQVYAPNEMQANDAVSKIREDFSGALEYWRGHFDTWVFVHNAREGLGPHIIRVLNELHVLHAPIVVTEWGYEALRRRARKLCESDIASLLGGYAPSAKDMRELRYENIQKVLDKIAPLDPSLFQDIRPVPSDKLKYNCLSIDIQNLLTLGMQKADLVRNLFRDHPNPQYGDEIALAFNKEYKRCKESNTDANMIFFELQKFAGGEGRGHPRYEAAILAVLAYFFEQCEIFERSPTGIVI